MSIVCKETNYVKAVSTILRSRSRFYRRRSFSHVNVKDDNGGVSSSLVQSLFSVLLKDGSRTVALSLPHLPDLPGPKTDQAP